MFTERQLEIIVRAAVMEATRPMSEQIADMTHRLADGDVRMGRIESDLKDNTASTAEMREAFDVAKKGLALMGSLGNALKWIVGLLAPIGGLWALWKGHKP